METKRTNTLMFQLMLCFAVILMAVLLLIATSWNMTTREAWNSAGIAKLTEPYARLFMDLDRLRNGRSGILAVNDEGSETSESEAIFGEMNQSAEALVEALNEGGFERASLDFRNTLHTYRDLYWDIVSSYDRQDYAQVNLGIERLNQSERWLRSYLTQAGTAISARADALRAQSAQARGRYYQAMLLLGSAIFVLCVMTLAISARRFVAPVEELCRNVRAFRLSDSAEALRERGVPCRPNSLREIRTLATAIYSMQDTVLGQYAVEKHNEQLKQKLVAEAMHTAQVERRLQEAQLKALQAQINPHFLFNTLNMIGQMAYLEGAERTTDLLDTFSRFFRYNVESFERNVTIAEEIENVRGYVALQRERFGERIRYQIEMDHAVEAIQVPSLIIQPLVENALSHGLRLKTDGGKVRVSVTALEAGGFEILVADNGCGMDAEALRALREQVDASESDDRAEHRSIGLSNVVSRMRLTFGERFRCDIEGTPGEGFAVCLRVEEGGAP